MSWTDPIVILAALAVLAMFMLLLVMLIPSLPDLQQALIGVKVDPQVVGLLRGIVVYFLPIAVASTLVWVRGWTSPILLPIIPTVIALIRLLESMIDAHLKPQQNVVNPPPVAGGGGPELLQ